MQRGCSWHNCCTFEGRTLDLWTLASAPHVLQVSLPHYQNLGFLSRGVTRYRALLLLMQQHQGRFLCPTYDIDLCWHAHQARPAVPCDSLLRCKQPGVQTLWWWHPAAELIWCCRHHPHTA